MRHSELLLSVRAIALAWLFAAVSMAPAAAQTATEAALADLRSVVERQRALLEEQSRLIEAQGRELQTFRERLAETTQLAQNVRNDIAELKKVPTSPTTTAAVAAAAGGVQEPQRTPEMPAPVVSAGDFPGSLQIPGTDAALKIGGQARMTLVQTLGPLGTDDRFVTSSIPAEGEERPGEDSRTNYSPAASRINLDVRSHTPIGPMRTFLEGDFAGSGRTMRLRHAFIQTSRWLFGQTWSTFSDPEAEPIGIDFEGLNAISLFRQPLVRYTRPIWGDVGLALALENPAPDLSGAQGVNLTPDFIARLRWQPERARGGALRLTRTEHVQAAVLVRTLRGTPEDQPDLTLSTQGFGVNVSGILVPRWDAEDRVKFASNAGWGIGRCITDLGTLGGQDAVYDADVNQLRALPVSSGYIGYERLWRPTFTSAITYGIVNAENLDIQPDTALQRTHRATINVTWTPIPQFDLVLEFLGGRPPEQGREARQVEADSGWVDVQILNIDPKV